MDERKRTGHTVSLDEREHIAVTGVTDVEEFNEDGIRAQTLLGLMIIKGVDLAVKRLDLEAGVLEIEGEIESLEYKDGAVNKGSVLSRIFK
jgi:sporulation protein YabP